MSAVLVGGDRGLVLLQEQPYGWEVWERTDEAWAGRHVWALAQTPRGLLAGTDAGLLRSTDRGVTWEPLLAGNARVIALDLRDADRYLVGLEPAALWRSDDGGAGWRELPPPGTPEERAEWHLPGPTPLETAPGSRVSTIARDPATPETIYVGVEIGGIYRSDDGGATWRSRHAGLPGLDVHQLAPHPLEPETLFAATETGVYRTVDGGEHWEELPLYAGATYTRALLAIPPDRTGERFTLLAAPAEIDPWGWHEQEDGARCRLFRSVDDGARWRRLTFGLPDFFEGLIAAIVASPDDPDRLWLGSWDGRVFTSRDRGLNWTQIAEDLGAVWALCPLDDE